MVHTQQLSLPPPPSSAVQGTGYVIPAVVAQHVLEDLARHGKLTGFARLGFVYQVR
jgi:hypothetical protein